MKIISKYAVPSCWPRLGLSTPSNLFKTPFKEAYCIAYKKNIWSSDIMWYKNCKNVEMINKFHFFTYIVLLSGKGYAWSSRYTPNVWLPMCFFFTNHTFQLVTAKIRQETATAKLPYLKTSRREPCNLSINYFCNPRTSSITP